MTTIGDLVDRTLRNWLIPPDDQPITFALGGSLDDSSATVPYDATLLTPELEEILGPGTLVEVGFEQILLGTVDTGMSQITNCVRGANGTTPAAHSLGDPVILTPTYARQAILDAISDAISALHPDLYQIKSTEITVKSTYNEAPADMISPVHFSYVDSFGLPVEASVQWSQLFPDSSTGKAIVVQAVPETTGHLSYYAGFPRPTDPTDTLDSLGLKESWARLLVIEAVHQVITVRDLSRATSEFLTRQLSQQGFPVPSASEIRDGLLRYRAQLLTEAKADLTAQHGVTAVVTFPQDSPWR